MGDHMNPHLIHGSLGLTKSSSQMASQSVQPFLHSSQQSGHILCNGSPIPASKLPVPMRYLHPSTTRWFPGPSWVLNPSSISISSAVFARFTSVTDRHTYRPCYSVCNNRLHLCTVHNTAMWPNSNSNVIFHYITLMVVYVM